MRRKFAADVWVAKILRSVAFCSPWGGGLLEVLNSTVILIMLSTLNLDSYQFYSVYRMLFEYMGQRTGLKCNECDTQQPRGEGFRHKLTLNNKEISQI